MSAPLNNLPVQLIPLVGRRKEIVELSGLLNNPDIRLITLYGFGGSGKTRLAVEIGQKVLDIFPDGVWFVALAPLTSPEHMITATASALGFTLTSPTDQQNQLYHFLQGKQLLLIFDNLEHLLPEGAAFIEAILQNAPQARLLVTSRQPINALWEWAYTLGGLDYTGGTDTSEGATPDAATLFLQHLRRQGHPVTSGDLVCATQISQLVGGLPLALLLAASWGRALGCEAIGAEIRRGIGFLQARQQAFPDRHSSMQAVFDTSWRLLSDSERAALRKLATFRGGFDREAAAKVAGAHLSIIATLVDQSLVERIASDRYRIHELLRQYLHDRLAEAGEVGATRDAHLAYYTSLAEQAEPELLGEKQHSWIDRLKLEIDNLSVALEWSLDNQEPSRVEMGLRMLVATERLWILHLLTKTGFSYLFRLLTDAPDNQFQRTYTRGLNLAGWLSFLLEDLPESRRYTAQALQIGLVINDCRLLGDTYYVQSLEALYWKEYQAAQSYAQKSLAKYREVNYIPGIAQALDSLGRAEAYCGDFSAAMPNLTAALDLAKKLGDVRIQYSILRSLGELALFDPQIGLQQARAYLQAALDYAHQFNDKFYSGHILNSLGEIARQEEQLEQAARYFEDAISIEKELGRQVDLMLEEDNLAFVFSRLGKYDQSRPIFLRNLDLALKSDHLADDIPYCLLGLAGVAVAQGEAHLAATVLGAIDAVNERILFYPTDRAEYERINAATRAQLSADQFGRLFREGQALGETKVAQLFLNPVAIESPAKLERLSGLTPREIEVLRLVAYGLSDQAVAERLVISTRTVNAHLTSIYSKLGVNSRAAAAGFARDKGLV